MKVFVQVSWNVGNLASGAFDASVPATLLFTLGACDAGTMVAGVLPLVSVAAFGL